MPNVGFLGWAYITASTSTSSSFPQGIEGSIQYKSGSSFGGDSNLVFDNTTNILTVSGSTYVTGNVAAGEFVGPLDGAIRFSAVNNAGTSITRGQVLYINGIQGQTPTVGLAACDDPATMPAFGVADENATTGSTLKVVTFGSIQNLNLTSLYGPTFHEGQTVYVATGSGGAGRLTNVAPTGSGNLLQNIGKVVRNGGGGDGQLKIGGAGRTNATPNLDKGFIFIGNDSDQTVQSNVVFVSASAQKVGINDTDPSYGLSVSGTLQTSVGTSYLRFDSSGLQFSGSSGDIALETDGDTFITSNGGIGSMGLDGLVYNTSSANSHYAKLTNNAGVLSVAGVHSGDVLIAGSGVGPGVSQHTLVYLDSSSNWQTLTASVTGSGDSSMIGITISTSPQADGVLSRGMYRLPTTLLSSSSGTGSLDIGQQVFASPITNGGYTTVSPTGSGNIVRVVGHSISSEIVFFNPSPDFIEI
jgi:hypothetical protein